MRRDLLDFSTGWEFEGRTVRLPHSAVDLPLSYFDETRYQRAFTYQKRFEADPQWADREVAIVFEGAMADAVVHLNGQEIVRHRDGYTPFEARLTEHLRDGENVLSVTIDGRENPEIPPFGGQIDYLTYAGIYRPAWLRVSAPVFIASAKVETPDALAARKSVRLRVEIANPQGLDVSGRIVARLVDENGRVLATTEASLTPSPLAPLPRGERGTREAQSAQGFPSPLAGDGGLGQRPKTDEGGHFACRPRAGRAGGYLPLGYRQSRALYARAGARNRPWPR